jgi:uncharacterized membrane protein
MFGQAGGLTSRLSVVVGLLLAVACSNGTAPDARRNALHKWGLPVDSSITLRVLHKLDGNDITVTGFNRYDVVAGYRMTASGPQVFRSRNFFETFDPPVSGFMTLPIAGINDLSQVVGGLMNDTAFRAYIWWHNKHTTLLGPTFPPIDEEGPLGCIARAITNDGNIAGSCMPNVNSDIVQWGPDGSIVRESCCGFATALTDNGYLTGYNTNFDPPQAFIWTPGAADYEFLGPPGQEVSGGLAVNNTGSVVGWRELAFGDTAALLWVPGQSERIISHLGIATGIDDAGNVVGFHKDSASAQPIAFLWNSATGAHFLPGLGGASAAVAISNANPEILGWATDGNGVKHSVIWTYPTN